MKIKILNSFVLILGLMLLLQSASGGRAANGEMDRTGAPGSAGTCGGYCHQSVGLHPNPQFGVTVKNAAGMNVNSYIPDETYTLEFTMTSGGAPVGYGMQAVILDSLNLNGGTMLTASTSNTQITTVSNGRSFVEHQGVNSTGVFRVTWTAPTVGTGALTVYGVGLAVDGSGTTNGDDFSAPIQFTLTENIVNDVKGLEKSSLKTAIFPNPSTGVFQLENKDKSGRRSIVVTNIQGQIVHQEEVYMEEKGMHSLALTELKSGIYIVQIQSDLKREVIKIEIN